MNVHSLSVGRWARRLVLSLALCSGLAAAELPADVTALQDDWAVAYFNTTGDAQETAMAELVTRSEAVVAAHPDTAEALIWRAIVLSTDAKVSGGLAARGKVAEARRLLLKAESLNPTAMDGSIPASLGSLYANVPGWPLSYGDKKKAAEYLKAALAIDPDNINTLFFLGDLQHKQGDNAAARASFEKALATPPRSGREVADAGRRREIRQALVSLQP
tara:strand:+ start:626 stop:1279 length:654 start_codon:yes stop_codon:yes gene_type:complete